MQFAVNAFFKLYSIFQTRWLDAETKNFTLEKLAKVYVEIGYPDELLNLDVLDSYHSYLDLNSTNSVKTSLGISGNTIQFYKLLNYFKNSWFLLTNPDSVNAVYLNDTNTICKYLTKFLCYEPKRNFF